MLHPLRRPGDSAAGAAKCYLRETWFKDPSGRLVCATDLKKFDRVLSSEGGLVTVVDCVEYEKERQVLVKLQTKSSDDFVVTGTHRIMVLQGVEEVPRPAGRLKVGSVVVTTCGLEPLQVCDQWEEEVAVVQSTFQPDVPVAAFQHRGAILTRGHATPKTRRSRRSFPKVNIDVPRTYDPFEP